MVDRLGGDLVCTFSPDALMKLGGETNFLVNGLEEVDMDVKATADVVRGRWHEGLVGFAQLEMGFSGTCRPRSIH